MKRLFNWQVGLSAVLIMLSAAVYYLHFLMFRDAHHIFLYLVGDIAFVFIEVLLVTIIIHQMLSYREKKALLKKLNMVIGAFFSEAGRDLIKSFCSFDPGSSKIGESLVITKDWTDREFISAMRKMAAHASSIDHKRGDLVRLKELLSSKRDFLLALLENPNLLEHETFTNLLWAVFHLTEELMFRRDLKALPQSDYEHIAGDMKRVYTLLVSEWIAYMKHLKTDYPYLFSLAMRTNPFDLNACVEVQ